MSDKLAVLAEGLDHIESVAWDPRRQLAVAGGEEGQLYSIDLAGRVDTFASTGGSVLGVAVTCDGTVMVCDVGRRQVLEVDWQSGISAAIPFEDSSVRLTEPNGICATSHGIYFTDSGHWGKRDGVLYHAPRGAAARAIATHLRYPNGCAVVDDHLYVVESGTRRILRFDVGESRESRSGAASPVVTARLPPSFPDGLAHRPAAGLLYVGCYRPDRIYQVDLNLGNTDRAMVEELIDDPTGLFLPCPTGLAHVEDPRGGELLLIAAFGGRSLLSLKLTPDA